MRQEVRGVSTGAVALPGLFRSGDARPTTVKLVFADCGRPRPEDMDRVASELACGVYAYGALPWLSLESTCDRGAKRLSTLHPCYRGTLIGRCCLELDVALKAVGGTAHGGLFLDCEERDLFLDKECATYDWGPNAQGVAFPLKRTRRRPLATISQTYKSFRTSDPCSATSVRDWKVEWERTWDGDATGADVKAQLEVLEVCDEELDGRRTLHARASIPWSVAIHAGSGSQAAKRSRNAASYCARRCCRACPSRGHPSVIGSLPRITIGWPTSCHYAMRRVAVVRTLSSKTGHGLDAPTPCYRASSRVHHQ